MVVGADEKRGKGGMVCLPFIKQIASDGRNEPAPSAERQNKAKDRQTATRGQRDHSLRNLIQPVPRMTSNDGLESDSEMEKRTGREPS